MQIFPGLVGWSRKVTLYLNGVRLRRALRGFGTVQDYVVHVKASAVIMAKNTGQLFHICLEPGISKDTF